MVAFERVTSVGAALSTVISCEGVGGVDQGPDNNISLYISGLHSEYDQATGLISESAKRGLCRGP